MKAHNSLALASGSIFYSMLAAKCIQYTLHMTELMILIRNDFKCFAGWTARSEHCSLVVHSILDSYRWQLCKLLEILTEVSACVRMESASK